MVYPVAVWAYIRTATKPNSPPSSLLHVHTECTLHVLYMDTLSHTKECGLSAYTLNARAQSMYSVMYNTHSACTEILLNI